MYEKSEMLYLYVETPLHAGSGGSVGVVDLPIQRERVTKYPVVQASGIKGKLRSEAYEWKPYIDRKAALKTELMKGEKKPDEKEKDFERRCDKEAGKNAAKELGLEAVFGPESDEADHHAGALSPGDARLLLFPVRSLVGVFAWTTSRNVLARLKRDCQAAGITVSWNLDNVPDKEETAWTVDEKSIVADNKVVLEEFTFPAKQHSDVKTIAEWLRDSAFPQSDEYAYFREKIVTNLVILPENAFRDFTQFATEVVTRIRINQETKTVDSGALWTEEHLPSDTVLYSPLHASRPRTDNIPNGWDKSAEQVLKFLRELKLDRIQLGGDETVGRGIVKLHMNGGKP